MSNEEKIDLLEQQVAALNSTVESLIHHLSRNDFFAVTTSHHLPLDKKRELVRHYLPIGFRYIPNPSNEIQSIEELAREVHKNIFLNGDEKETVWP